MIKSVMSVLTKAQQEELASIANKIVSPGHGILAADESTGTIGKRFSAINVDNSEQNRQQYRQLLFNTGRELGTHISGVILYDETFWQRSDEGLPFPALLKQNGISVGIKVDSGLVGLNADEHMTQGFDNLDARCAAYKKGGADFTKWRCVLTIGERTPSHHAINLVSSELALYALISQRNGLVPIVEPEILCDGTHSIQICEEVSTRVFTNVYKALSDFGVFLEGTLLKPNMVTSGMQASPRSSPHENAAATLRALRRTIPAAVPGIVFLSGGFSEAESTQTLNQINVQANENRLKHPWVLTFSYGRALQHSVLRAWNGDGANVEAARKQLLVRAKACGEASLGVYEESVTSSNSDSLFVAKHVY